MHDGPERTGGDGADNRIVLFGKALSDPIRMSMLGLLADGRSCCGLPPTIPGQGIVNGICVCELQTHFKLAQSKVSYHLGVLKEAGLIQETNCGKWTLYTLDKAATREGLEAVKSRLKL